MGKTLVKLHARVSAVLAFGALAFLTWVSFFCFTSFSPDQSNSDTTFYSIFALRHGYLWPTYPMKSLLDGAKYKEHYISLFKRGRIEVSFVIKKFSVLTVLKR